MPRRLPTLTALALSLAATAACGGSATTGGSTPGRIVQPATAHCPAFRDDGNPGLTPVHLPLPHASAVALGEREVVWRDHDRLLAVPVAGSAAARTIYRSEEQLGNQLVVDGRTVFVSDGPEEAARRLMRIGLHDRSVAVVTTLEGARYEPIEANASYVFLWAPCAGPEACEAESPPLRVAKEGGALEALESPPPHVAPLSSTPRGLLLTTTERDAEGKAVGVIWRWDDAGGLTLIARIPTDFDHFSPNPIVIDAKASGDEIIAALDHGAIYAVPSAGGEPRLVAGLRGGVAAFDVTESHFLVMTHHPALLQITRREAVDEDATDRATILGVEGETMQQYGSCLCTATPAAEHPHGETAESGFLSCAPYPAPEER